MANANWLRELREANGIRTQGDLEARLQLQGITITRAAISHWENGRYNPPLEDSEFRQALAFIFQIDELELLRRAGFVIDDEEHTDAGKTAARLVDRLPAEQQKLAIKLLRQLEG